MLFDSKWEQKVAIEPWRQVLLDAADYIETHGWSQGLSRQGSAVCAMEAINSSSLQPGIAKIALSRFSRAVTPLHPEPDGRDVISWNDHPDQTKWSVVTTMRAVAR
jgi:hypothetical protein